MRLRVILLEGEILAIALAQDIPKLSKRMPDVVARARIRGIRATLDEKIVKANDIMRRRRALHQQIAHDRDSPLSKNANPVVE